jgi:hypothetical protein
LGEHPERVGVTFNLSKQLNTELDKLRLELEGERDIRTSKSEIAEVALRIALEDVQRGGRESELVKRLSGRQATQATGAPDEGGLTVQRSVDEAGFIVEITYDENGEIVDEDVVASVAELPVEAEYVDDSGRLVSLAKDELGNTFEQVTDEELNTLGTRMLFGTQATGDPDEGGLTVQRSVDEAGFIVEITYDENGEIVDEDVVASVAELPVEAEYVDDSGRLVSLAKDELGNTFELIMDEELNTLGARMLPGAN